MVLQFAQDNDYYGGLAKFVGERLGEVQSISPFWDISFLPADRETWLNEILFLRLGQFKIIDQETEGSVRLYFNHLAYDTVISAVNSYAPPNIYYDKVTYVQNYFVRAVTNFVNIQMYTFHGYLVTFKEDIFTPII